MNTAPTAAVFHSNRVEMEARNLAATLGRFSAAIASVQADANDLTTNAGKNVLARTQANLAQLQAQELADVKQVVGAVGQANLYQFLDGPTQALVTSLIGAPTVVPPAASPAQAAYTKGS